MGRAIGIGTGVASGSTGSAPASPGLPTIVDVSTIDGTPDGSGVAKKQVVVTYSPPSTTGTFTGVDVFLDAPDSAGQLSIADGTVPADGSIAAGNFNPTFIGYFPYADTDPPTHQTNQARFICPALTIPAYWRVYVLPASSARRSTPIEFGLTGASPSEQFFVPPPATATSGREYAPNVVNPALADATLYPAGWSSNPHVVLGDSGDQYFEYAATWQWPSTDQNFQALGGVNLVLSDGVRQTYIGNANVGGAGAGSTSQPIYISAHLPVRPGTTSYTLYLIAFDVKGNSNSLVTGITPQITFSVVRSSGAAGSENCVLVTSDGVHAFVTAVPAVAADGTALLQVDGYWKHLNQGDAGYDPQFGGAEIVVDKADGHGPVWSVAKGTLSPIENFIPQPATNQNWVFYLRSIDINGKPNTIVPGTTPSTTINVGSSAGQLNLGKAATTSFSPQFTIVSGALTVNALNANIITVGTSKVGNNGSGFPIELDIYDHLGSLIGWFGDDTANSGFVGGWCKQFRIGGANPASAQIVADASGNVTISGTLIVGSVASATSAGSAGSVPASGVGSGTLPGGVVYAGTINCSQLNAGTISVSVTLTAPTIVVTSGTVTINIDFTNFIKVSDSSTSQSVQLLATGLIWSGGSGTFIGQTVWSMRQGTTLRVQISTLGGAGTGSIKFFDTSSGVNGVGFKAPSTVSTPVLWVLPPADGTSGQKLTTDGSGNLSWT